MTDATIDRHEVVAVAEAASTAARDLDRPTGTTVEAVSVVTCVAAEIASETSAADRVTVATAILTEIEAESSNVESVKRSAAAPTHVPSPGPTRGIVLLVRALVDLSLVSDPDLVVPVAPMTAARMEIDQFPLVVAHQEGLVAEVRVNKNR